MQVCPPSLAPRVRAVAGKRLFTGPVDASASAQVPEGLLDRCMDGVEGRGRLIEHLLREESPELFITVFSGTQPPSHLLWHTAPRVGNRPGPPPPPDGPGLVDVFREVDRQMGRVLMLAGDEAAVLVFSLHGMQDTRGVPLLLDPLFRAVKLATPFPSRGFRG